MNVKHIPVPLTTKPFWLMNINNTSWLIVISDFLVNIKEKIQMKGMKNELGSLVFQKWK